MPAFNVRRSAEIQDQLVSFAAAEGYIPVPIHDYIDDNYYPNDIGYTACHYSSVIGDQMSHDDSTFKSIMFTKNYLAGDFAREF
jgi:ankyrin repeat protein